MRDYTEINRIIKAGGVVLLPTETVYGLACSAVDAQAVQKIYAMKGRDFQKPLAVCVRDLEMAQRFGVFSPKAADLAKRYWPGSLTLVVEAKQNISIDSNCQSKLGQTATIAFRCPEAYWLNHLDGPLALTSANRSGEKECTSFTVAASEFGEDIDAGLETDIPLSGLPSTIISIVDEDFKILRQGTLKVSL